MSTKNLKTGKKNDSANEFKQMGNNAFRSGKFIDAITLYSSAIRLDPRNHVLYSNRSMAYFEKQQFHLALEDADTCIILNPDWPKGYLRKAKALRGQGLFCEAKETYVKGMIVVDKDPEIKRVFSQRLMEVSILLETFPKGIGITAVAALEEIAMRQYAKEDFDKSIRNLEAVFALKKDMLKKESKDLELIINKVVGLYKAKGKYLVKNGNSFGALPFYERAAGLLRSRYGDVPAVAVVQNEMAMILKKQGKLDDALRVLERILSIFEKSSDRINIAETMVNIGNILELKKKYKEALGYYQNGLKKMQSAKGKKHPDVATTLMNIGIILRKSNNATEAKKYFSQALPILETNFGVDSKEYAQGLMLLGKSEMDLKAFQRAIDPMTHALKIQQSVLGDHEETVVSLDQIGIAYSQIQKTTESLKYFQQALEMRQKINGTNHHETGVAAMKVGATLIALRQWVIAAKHLEQAVTILKKTRGISHNQTKIAIQNLEIARGKLN